MKRFFPPRRTGGGGGEGRGGTGRRASRAEEEKPPFQKKRGFRRESLPSPLPTFFSCHIQPVFYREYNTDANLYGTVHCVVHYFGVLLSTLRHVTWAGFESRNIKSCCVPIPFRAPEKGMNPVGYLQFCTLRINFTIAEGITADYTVTYILPSLSSGSASRYSFLLQWRAGASAGGGRGEVAQPGCGICLLCVPISCPVPLSHSATDEIAACLLPFYFPNYPCSRH